ncbi:Spy/CpxP family protein refolding chaperone [Hahella aquimaris]|uniref:Spy/CpxP family protein refolding chaperone n=1 Tax=Hahella sp. HNIBRBA332 TaxID=3015983 RepID=UPI00273C20AD|nr:Spy/CpxP family protein refolding chaperone [Hahella sp. HNIBRBA332]WLQ13000.1 Spy/CpxP family protein refolding chaperone [Hahella sp. HNIBRBA332]
MKKFAAFTLTCLIAASGFALAKGGPHQGPNIDRLAEKLALTDEQKTQFETIMEESREQRHTLMEQYKPQREEMHTAMENLRTQTDAKLGAVLNAEQMEKLKEMHEMRGQHKERRRHPENCDKGDDEEA